jgi:predicted DsbA family dithiol-disulfide isomerase
MTQKNAHLSALHCDPQLGICGVPTPNYPTHIMDYDTTSLVTIRYFTDPICSSCWAIEPTLRKLKLVYGDQLYIDYRMGGLLPDWSYKSNGIEQPSDVAQHWDDVSVYYDMPIDGSIWLTNPLDSSYPPSIAFKAIQLHDPKRAKLFLRNIRERVFLYQQNIADPAILEDAAVEVGHNLEQFRMDFAGEAKKLFEADLELAKAYHVRSFPTQFVSTDGQVKQVVVGLKSYSDWVQLLHSIAPPLVPSSYNTDWETLFQAFSNLTALEFSELSGMERKQTPAFLDELVASKSLQKFSTKNGDIWFLPQA